MVPLKAHVRNGRLVLDEPTDLPEGDVVYLTPVEGSVVVAPDELDADERAALARELDLSIAEADAGHTVSAEVVLAELRLRHQA